MRKAAIAIDDWKLAIFERHLKQAGYSFDKATGGLIDGVLIICVETENLEALAAVVAGANDEARRSGPHHG